METKTQKLIGPAGQLADLFGRTLDDGETTRLKLLFTGAPGIGKTELANRIAASLTGDGGRYAIESVNGRKCTIHTVADWQRLVATSCMFGTGWRVFVVNEVDTCPADAQDLLLTFLDELPANCAFVATSNLDLDKLSRHRRARRLRRCWFPRACRPPLRIKSRFFAADACGRRCSTRMPGGTRKKCGRGHRGRRESQRLK